VEWMSSEAFQRKLHVAVIRFDGQVAIVTGAGGRPRPCLRAGTAKRGAKVVVNDFGDPQMDFDCGQCKVRPIE